MLLRWDSAEVIKWRAPAATGRPYWQSGLVEIMEKLILLTR